MKSAIGGRSGRIRTSWTAGAEVTSVSALRVLRLLAAAFFCATGLRGFGATIA